MRAVVGQRTRRMFQYESEQPEVELVSLRTSRLDLV